MGEGGAAGGRYCSTGGEGSAAGGKYGSAGGGCDSAGGKDGGDGGECGATGGADGSARGKDGSTGGGEGSIEDEGDSATDENWAAGSNASVVTGAAEEDSGATAGVGEAVVNTIEAIEELVVFGKAA